MIDPFKRKAEVGNTPRPASMEKPPKAPPAPPKPGRNRRRRVALVVKFFCDGDTVSGEFQHVNSHLRDMGPGDAAYVADMMICSTFEAFKEHPSVSQAKLAGYIERLARSAAKHYEAQAHAE